MRSDSFAPGKNLSGQHRLALCWQFIRVKHIINAGKATLLRTNQGGENMALATLNKSRALGEMAVLDGEWRSATHTVASKCILLTLSSESLDKMLLEFPRTAARAIRAVAISLSRRLRMTDGKLVDYQI